MRFEVRRLSGWQAALAILVGLGVVGAVLLFAIVLIPIVVALALVGLLLRLALGRAPSGTVEVRTTRAGEGDVIEGTAWDVTPREPPLVEGSSSTGKTEPTEAP